MPEKVQKVWKWQQQQSNSSVHVRYGAHLVYLASEERLVLFGGYNNNVGPEWLGDTWSINLEKMEFQKLKVPDGAVPSPRYSGIFVSTKGDVFKSAAYLFGGDDGGNNLQKASKGGSSLGYMFGSFFNDLWIFQEGIWKEVKNTRSDGDIWPTARSCHSGVMTNDRFILTFGGVVAPEGVGHKTVDSNELWVFDAKESRWHHNGVNENGDAPTRRHGHSAASIDTSGGSRMYIYGGQTKKKNHIECRLRYACTRTLDDLWIYKFSKLTKSGTWHKIARRPSETLRPGNRVFASLQVVGNTDARNLMLFGGADCSPGCDKMFSDMWTYSIQENRWVLDIPNGQSRTPIHRYRQSLTWVPTYNSFVLFGGESYKPSLYFNDLWTLSYVDYNYDTNSTSSLLSLRQHQQILGFMGVVRLVAACFGISVFVWIHCAQSLYGKQKRRPD